MKLKDYVFDSDLQKATLFLVEVNSVQLENLLMILRDDPKEPQDETDYNAIIYGED